jgi:hypothetical protein
VDVLGEIRVEHVLEQAGVAAVVLGGDEHERVGAVHLLRERRILRRLTGLVGGNGERRGVDQLRLDSGALLELGVHHTRCVLAHSAGALRAQDDRDRERSDDIGHQG